MSALETALDLDSTRYYYLGTCNKWIPGDRAKSAPALQRAIEFAERQFAVTPKDYELVADLARHVSTRLAP